MIAPGRSFLCRMFNFIAFWAIAAPLNLVLLLLLVMFAKWRSSRYALACLLLGAGFAVHLALAQYQRQVGSAPCVHAHVTSVHGREGFCVAKNCTAHTFVPALTSSSVVQWLLGFHGRAMVTGSGSSCDFPQSRPWQDLLPAGVLSRALNFAAGSQTCEVGNAGTMPSGAAQWHLHAAQCQPSHVAA